MATIKKINKYNFYVMRDELKDLAYTIENYLKFCKVKKINKNDFKNLLYFKEYTK